MVNVSAQSFERAMHNEATKSRRVTVPAGTRECKQSSAPGEVPVKVLSDRGSTPLTSTRKVSDNDAYRSGKTPVNNRGFVFSYFFTAIIR